MGKTQAKKQKVKKLITGKDVIIDKTAIIKRPELVKIGNHVAIDPFFFMTTQGEIGDYIHISALVSVIGGAKTKLIMKDFTTIAAGCRLICGSDDFSGGTGFINPFVPQRYKSKQKQSTIVMEKHSALGTNVIVFPGVTIGEGAVVGAGSLVLESIEPWTVNAGTPAVIIKKRPKETILKYEKQIKAEEAY